MKDLIEPHITIGWVKGSENKADELTRLAYAEKWGVYPHPREKALRVLRKLLTDQVEELLHRTVEVEKELRESKSETA